MTPTAPPSVAIIIPVRNDDAALARLLAMLRSSEFNGIGQILIASSLDTPATRAIAAAHNAGFIVSEAGRGIQMNTAAARADADVLWFLHADAQPAPDSIAAIREQISRGRIGGYFRFRFAGLRSNASRRLAALINWRADRGIAYGDQGLFFVRSFFEEAGGFSDEPLFEEVTLVRRARATGHFGPTETPIGVDPRRWQKTGWIRRTLINRALALGHAAGVSPHRLAAWYRRF